MSLLQYFFLSVYQLAILETRGNTPSGLKNCVETCHSNQNREPLSHLDLACCFLNTNDFSRGLLKAEFYQAIFSHCESWHVLQEDKTTKKKPKNKCPADFIPYRTSCYYFNNTPVTWTSASGMCASLGADLVKVEDEKEDHFIVSHLEHLPLKDRLQGYWMDGQNIDNLWRWGDGTDVLYTRWGPGEPDGFPSQAYLAFIHPAYWYSDFQWGSHGGGCGAVCEKKLTE